MAQEKSEKLYRVLNETDPSKAPEIVHKYNRVMAGVDAALTHQDSDSEIARQAKTHLETITDDVIYRGKKADLIDSFDRELDSVAESLGIAVSVPTNIEVADGVATGFAERYKESELRDVFNSYSMEQWHEIIGTLLVEGTAALDIPKEKQYRIEQLNAIITALEAMAKKIKDSKGAGEDIQQLFEFDETTKARADKITGLIEEMKRYGIEEIVQNGLTVQEVFEKYHEEFGKDVKNILISNDESRLFFDEHRNLLDITDEKKKREYSLTLVKFLRDHGDYQTAQSILEELMSNEFQQAIEMIPGREMSNDTSEQNIKGRLYDEADAKIGKIVTAKVIEQWRKEGMTRDQIEDAKRNLRDTHYERLLHQYAAEHILVGDLSDGEEGHNSILITGENKAFWEQYSDMLDPKGEAFNLTDESWDMILEELVYTAPLIIISGGVAAAAAKGLSYGARAVLAGTRLAAWGARLAKGGRLARGAYRMGKLSAQATGLLVEGTLFELTFEGIQGELIFAQEDWVKKILWTSAALGVFKGAGKLGGKGAEAVNKALAEIAPKLADKNLVKLINQLLIVGHTQVVAMLLIGAAQHLSEGEFAEFWENFGYQIFHAYVAVGSLNIAHGVISTAGGTIFKPGRSKTEAKEPAATVKPEVVRRVMEAIGARQSKSIEISKGRDFVEATETLKREGFEFEITDKGELLAKKGNIEIHLKQTGALQKIMTRVAAQMSNLNRMIQGNGGRIDAKIVDQIMATLRGIATSLRNQGFSKRTTAAASLLILSGCDAVEKGIKGSGSGLEWIFYGGIPLAGLTIGTILLIGGVMKGLPTKRMIKAFQQARKIKLESNQATNATTDMDLLNTRIEEMKEKLIEFNEKIDEPHNAVTLDGIVTIITELQAEIVRVGGPRQRQLMALNTRFTTELNKIHISKSKFFTWENSLKLAGAVLILTTALAWFWGQLGSSGTDDEEEIPDIPIGTGGGDSVDQPVEEEEGSGTVVVPEDIDSTGANSPADPGTAPAGGETPPQKPDEPKDIEFFE